MGDNILDASVGPALHRILSFLTSLAFINTRTTYNLPISCYSY